MTVALGWLSDPSSKDHGLSRIYFTMNSFDLAKMVDQGITKKEKKSLFLNKQLSLSVRTWILCFAGRMHP